jgi:hypothetical protein
LIRRVEMRLFGMEIEVDERVRRFGFDWMLIRKEEWERVKREWDEQWRELERWEGEGGK